MSDIESLAAEASPLLGVQMTIKAAEQLYYGDRQLLTPCSNIQPGLSGESSASESKKKDKKKGKKDEEEKPETIGQTDGLRAAINNAKETLRKALEGTGGEPPNDALDDLRGEVGNLKQMCTDMKQEIDKLRNDFNNLLDYIYLGKGALPGAAKQGPAKTAASVPAKQQPTEKAAPGGEGDKEDDFDLFGSSDEEEDAEKERIKQERLKAYAEKKAKKPESIAKSSVILDVKPWDDTTNMQEMEKQVRQIERDGLVWGGAKLIPLAYGIKKLQIICVVEDEKVSVDDLIDQITEDISDHVQSVDIVAFNKI